jgi:hypothetical protein
MARMGLATLGLSQQHIDRAENTYRTRDGERMNEQLSSGDLRAARDRILTQPERSE